MLEVHLQAWGAGEISNDQLCQGIVWKVQDFTEDEISSDRVSAQKWKKQA